MADETADFDAGGTMLLGLSVALYALAISGVTGGWTTAVLVVLAIVSVVGFVSVERRMATPLVQIAMLTDAKLVAGVEDVFRFLWGYRGLNVGEE